MSFNKGLTKLNDVKFNNVFNNKKIEAILVYLESEFESNNLFVRNIIHHGEFMRCLGNSIKMNNTVVKNYNTCEEDDSECLEIQKEYINNPETVLLRVEDKHIINVDNLNLNNIYFNTMLIYGYKSYINIEKMNLINGHFINGVVSCSDLFPLRNGNVVIKNSTISNVYSNNGPVVQVTSLSKLYEENEIIFDHVNIYNSKAEWYGGVVYSTSIYTNDIVLFNDCTFKNTTGKYGKVCHAYNRESEPKISNKEEILRDQGHSAFSTNPTGLMVDEEKYGKITILSGDILKDDIRFISLESDVSDLEISDLFFYKIGINDTKNTYIFGQTNGYCWEDSCMASNVRRKYHEFNDSIAYVEVNILECNTSSYKYQDRDNINLKSWVYYILY
ncbi:hypothetical protein PIROE2DRAFT_5098 [Piromyces sp. E2]|nr:hypothetical protein PIROE2DRAFT_5098 [Piromyces sp. E2]|eukprot:OUM67460.1 hypothetical protein PIROE2DRAFT_5098 [Piromyces sp. E2]